MQVVRPDQADEAVAQILALHEDEDRDDQDDEDGLERSKDRFEDGADGKER